MESNQLYLFRDQRFLPIFIVQFCGALNDSILKSALIILIAFKLSTALSISAQYLILLANALFIMPFFVFASIAGQLADRYERSTLVKIIKLVEILIVAITIYGFINVNLIILFICLTLMGIHSTFFGPIKYSVLPDKLRQDELISANGFIEAGTFLSILFGTIIGGFYNFSNNLILLILVITAIIGFVASLFMPKSNNYNPAIMVKPNIIRENIAIMTYAKSKKQLYFAILGISWFWFIAVTIMAQIPSLTKDILGADENVANLFLATFSIGVGVGSFWCNKIYGNEITTKFIFISALGISLFGIDLYFASKIATVSYQQEHLKTVIEFLSRKHYWRILVDLFFLSAIGGLYVVPLFALMQYLSSPAYRSRIIAANNLINSIFMAASTIVLSLLFYIGFSIPTAILLISILNIVVALYIYKLLPNNEIIPTRFWKIIFKFIFDIMYKVEVKGMENYEKSGDRTVIIANHLSYIDPPLIASYVTHNLIFAINLSISKVWWVKPFLKIGKALPVETDNPMAIKMLIKEVQKNQKVAIFPEGRISITGSLMKIYEGPGMIADKANANILPIRIEGTQFTIFSKINDIMCKGISLRRKITITILPPVKFTPPENLTNSKERRKYLGQALYDVMSEMMFEGANYKTTLFQNLINASKLHGRHKKVARDMDNNLNFGNILLKSFILGKLISRNTEKKEAVGIMLPTTTTTLITFFAMQAIGRIPAMINFTSGVNNIISACATSGVKTIYSSKLFIKKAELTEVIDSLKKAGIKIIFLEDLRKKLTLGLKLKSLIVAQMPQNYYDTICEDKNYDGLAVILFTSGTEGKPKAVALSHKNINANICQIMSRVDFNPHDNAFNTLPMFHSFGLTVTLVMMLNGNSVFLYPSPLHYRIIPELIYDLGATIMFGTDTFLTGYANCAHPYDFYSLRYVIAGAEKLKNKTKQLWLEKFGVRLLEGYGVTEASPVISVNTTMNNKTSTVGKIMPSIKYFLQPVKGIKKGGRLCVKGPNIMLGYIKPENPAVIEPVAVEKIGKDWYDTGDIVTVDDEGYITILGREKRFAKIGGEMVSLTAVEELASNADTDCVCAAVSIDDEKKGEQIILCTTSKTLTLDIINKTAQKLKISELHIPKVIITVKEMPMYVTGKLNYREILVIVEKYLKKHGSN
ncbi:MAG: acyl-[ACP]--phospholipid O-acyltransferase [Rickettsiaceae bacterium]|nr:acyl-[ACP]--phospholipid O-acyltransferase [Rickettsiaceae bacterium]